MDSSGLVKFDDANVCIYIVFYGFHGVLLRAQIYINFRKYSALCFKVAVLLVSNYSKFVQARYLFKYDLKD